MIFRTHDPYYNDEQVLINDNNDINKDCFICFELIDSYGETPIKLIKNTNYLTICFCNGCVHNECLHTWIKKTNRCPICREKLTLIDKNNNFYKILRKLNPHLLKFFLINKDFFIRPIKIIINCLFTYLFFCVLAEFYLHFFREMAFRLFLDKSNDLHDFNNYFNNGYYYENKYILENNEFTIIYEDFYKNYTYNSYTLLK